MSMTEEQYLTVQMQIISCAGFVADMPLGEFLERIHVAESAGPVLDPTLYLKAARNLEAIKELAQALVRFQAVALKLRSQT